MFKASHLNWNKLTLGVRLLFDILHKKTVKQWISKSKEKLGKARNFEMAIYRSLRLHSNEH